jgi:hypothetical protein
MYEIVLGTGSTAPTRLRGEYVAPIRLRGGYVAPTRFRPGSVAREMKNTYLDEGQNPKELLKTMY